MHPNQQLTARERLIAKQQPFAIIVSCSDSRVPPEIVFDQGLGDLFVVRAAGNVVGHLEIDSIEYAADKLGTALIVVVGHENCGAVTAVVNNQDPESNIEHVAIKIQPAVDQARLLSSNLLENAVKCNVYNVICFLQETPILKRLITENKLDIVGGYYNLDSGKVDILPLIPAH